MKSLILLLALSLALPVWGQQAYSGTPGPGGMYVSTNGNIAGPWNPFTAAAGTQAYSGTPGPVGLYYSSTGNIAGPWYPCTLATCFAAGTPGGAAGGALGGTYPNPTVVGAITPTTINGLSLVYESHTAAAVAELDFTTCLAGSPKYAVVTFQNVKNDTTGSIGVQVSGNSGSTYDTTAGHYIESRYYNQITGASSGITNDTSTLFNLGGNTATDTGVYAGTLNMINPATATTKMWNMDVVQFNGSDYYRINDGFVYNQTTAVNAFRVISSTTFTGTVTCVAYK